MAKMIKVKYDGTEYTLQFTRDTVARMERQGFNIREVPDKPVSMFPLLFSGAFLANHRRVKQDVIDEIFDNLPNKADLLEKLIDMYVEPFNSLYDENGDETKNGSWEMI